MGMFDTVGGRIQTKAGPCGMENYEIGDKAPFDDGCYIGYEGTFTVLHGHIVAITTEERVFDKWGGLLDTKEILDPRNPMTSVVSAVLESLRGGG